MQEAQSLSWSDTLRRFYQQGPVTVFSPLPSPWRWLVTLRRLTVEAVVVDQHDLVTTLADATLLPSARPTPEAVEEMAAILNVPVLDLAGAEPRQVVAAPEWGHFTQRAESALQTLDASDFRAPELPAALAGLFAGWQRRVQADAEAVLQLAQAGVADDRLRLLADMRTLAAFEQAAAPTIQHQASHFALAAVLDTALAMDQAMLLARQLLRLPARDENHLLRLSPDVLRAHARIIADQTTSSAFQFLLRARMLCEARQDVARLPFRQRLPLALEEGDLPQSEAWARRLAEAQARIFGSDALQQAGLPAAANARRHGG